MAQADPSHRAVPARCSRATGSTEVPRGAARRRAAPRQPPTRSRTSCSARRRTPTWSSRSSASCRAATPAWRMRIAGRSVPARGPALRRARRPARTTRSAGRSASSASTDRARHLASLFVDDLADVIRDGIDPRFELSRYGEKLAASAGTFDPLAEALDGPPTLVDRRLDDLARDCVAARARPDLVGLTVPFPGNLYGALRIAARRQGRAARRRGSCWAAATSTPSCASSTDPRVFDSCDYVTLDDGERPLLALIDHLRDPTRPLLRTYVREPGVGGAADLGRAGRPAPRATPARRPTTGCRSTATCRCSRCSTRCTGCGPTAAGTS